VTSRHARYIRAGRRWPCACARQTALSSPTLLSKTNISRWPRAAPSEIAEPSVSASSFRQRCPCRKWHPRRLGRMPPFVADAAEAVASVDVKPGVSDPLIRPAGVIEKARTRAGRAVGAPGSGSGLRRSQIAAPTWADAILVKQRQPLIASRASAVSTYPGPDFAQIGEVKTLDDAQISVRLDDKSVGKEMDIKKTLSHGTIGIRVPRPEALR
jgi:hypothetical protein